MSADPYSISDADRFSDVLRSTTFVSPSGRIYRLFPEESEQETKQEAKRNPEPPEVLKLPPEQPPELPSLKERIFSFDEILHQIEGLIASAPPAAARLRQSTVVRQPAPALDILPFAAVPAAPSPAREAEEKAEPPEEPELAEEPEPAAPVADFVWGESLNTLQQTAADQIQTLAEHLMEQRERGLRRICFSSVFSGDGCTTILLCAVRSLIDRGYRVLLIDAHHRHPNLPVQLQPPADAPSDAADETVVVRGNLGVRYWRQDLPLPENLSAMAEQADERQFDFVLIDGGSITEAPFQEIADFWREMQSDGTVLISNVRRVSEFSAARIVQRFEQCGINLIGITENCV